MFPESFARTHILAHTKRGELVFDPFSGRGTTVFESLLQGRPAIGTDTNLVAACIGGAKAAAPSLGRIQARLSQLRETERAYPLILPEGEFFAACFSEKTLHSIMHLRANLKWRTSLVDRFIAALALGSLHGESHRSGNYFSNRMPRTISTKPEYSVRWWRKHKSLPPDRNVWEILAKMAPFRVSGGIPTLRGDVRLSDARLSSRAFPSQARKVKLIVTSPPYLNTTDYAEDQWLRLWFLGAAARPIARTNADDRHLNLERYQSFLQEVWAGSERLLDSKSIAVIRIGGATMDCAQLFSIARQSLCDGLPNFRVVAHNRGVTTEIVNSQIKTFRPGLKRKRYEHDFTFTLMRK
jgi:hypothetical protein